MLNTVYIFIISFLSVPRPKLETLWLVFKLKIPAFFFFWLMQGLFLKSFLHKAYFLNLKDLSSDSFTNINLMQAFKT